MPYSIYIESEPTNLSTMNDSLRTQHAEIINAVAEDRMGQDEFFVAATELTIKLLVDGGVLTDADLVDGESTPEADEIISASLQELAKGMLEHAAARREILAAA